MAAQGSRATLRAGEAASRSAGLVGVTAGIAKRTIAIQGTTLLGDELSAVIFGHAAGAHGAVGLVAAVRRDLGKNS